MYSYHSNATDTACREAPARRIEGDSPRHAQGSKDPALLERSMPYQYGFVLCHLGEVALAAENLGGVSER
jgi:hypothetical protein